MAKDDGSRKPKAKRGSNRTYIVRDEKQLSPIFVDHSTLAVGTDVVVHSMFQSEIPPEGPGEGNESRSVLVGRFVYPADYFRALTVMFARQFIALQAAKGKGEEELNWLQQELVKQAARDGIARPKQSQ
jgi:hypothetical protein